MPNEPVNITQLIALHTLLRHNSGMNVSLIVTVYNERSSIQRLLDSLGRQTRRPDEIVICDGGSSDGTVELIYQYVAEFADTYPPLQLLIEPGANISRGRNLAIAAAKGPVIAATDAGVRLADDWLAHLVAPWDQAVDGSDGPLAVAGFFLPDTDGVFQTAMSATVLPLPDDIDPDTFLPSSRSVAFTKQAWAEAGGYPEWLDYCEDLLFDFGINDQAPGEPTGFDWAPDALVYFRPRESFSSFWTQYYRYARGDGKADLWRKRHAARYVVYLALLPALLGHAFFGFFARWLGWLGLLVGLVLYCRRPLQRVVQLGHSLTFFQRMLAVALVPAIRVVGDVAKMVGYPVGLWWRYRNRDRDEIHWR